MYRGRGENRRKVRRKESIGGSNGTTAIKESVQISSHHSAPGRSDVKLAADSDPTGCRHLPPAKEARALLRRRRPRSRTRVDPKRSAQRVLPGVGAVTSHVAGPQEATRTSDVALGLASVVVVAAADVVAAAADVEVDIVADTAGTRLVQTDAEATWAVEGETADGARRRRRQDP